MSEYGLSGYGDMIRDSVRLAAYARAVELAVKPGSVVLDIGTGTGVLALLAARSGAHKVVAVEPSELIDVARQTAKANGVADTIEFVQGLSTTLERDEPADVIVSDLRGVLPLYSTALPSIVDARRRLLAPGGTLIPRVDSLWASPIESAAEYQDHVASWETIRYELDLSAARPLAANTWWKGDGKAETLAAAERLATLDYHAIESPNVSSSARWTAERDGTLHGFAVWFDTELHAGIGFSNAADAPKTIYGQAFFPTTEPAEIAAGDEIALRFRASLLGGDYLFTWDTRVAEGHTGRQKARFGQSTLHSFPLTPERLNRLGETYTPVATDDGRAVAFLLSRADGRLTTRELAEELRERFPRRFRSDEDAIRFATRHTLTYCR